ncbi:RIKEN cDNA 1700016D06, isoform CRA_c, partial [Mus musculus]
LQCLATWSSNSSQNIDPTSLALYHVLVCFFQDEILVRDILEPGKAPYFENQSPSTTSQQKTTKEKDKQKEILFQLRSLEALEKMIDKIRRAIETKLKRRQKLQQSRSSQLLGKPIQP